MKKFYGFMLMVLFLVLASVSSASIMTFETKANRVGDYSNRTDWRDSIGVPTILEDFNDVGYCYIVEAPSINSNSNTTDTYYGGTPVTPGEIVPGVTFSTQRSNGVPYMSINRMGGTEDPSFDHEFLSGNKMVGEATGMDGRYLNVLFDTPVNGFGFDTNYLMNHDFDVKVNYVDGSFETINFKQPDGHLYFYGFTSDLRNIASADIYANDTEGDHWTAFVLDNFEFSNDPAPYVPPTSTPLPASALMFGFAFAGVMSLKRFIK